jgi:DeoR/GlpR family transcriptional regulator of sugar metabolism
MNVKDLFLSFEKRTKFNQAGKKKIAFRSAELIKTGDEIFLGAGTTVSFLGKHLAESKKHFMLKIWTNNLFVLNLWLKQYEGFLLENFAGVVAGEISRKNLSVVNISFPFSKVDKAIIGTPGISTKGMSSDDMNTVQQTEYIIKRAREVIVLADSFKVGRECVYQTRSMRMMKIDIRKNKKYTFITDASEGELYKKTIKKLRDNGICVIQT